MIDAINSINYTLNHPTRWEIASVIISALSLLFTIIIIFYNYKSIKTANKSIQQSMDLHLYEKRLKLLNDIQTIDAFKAVPIEIKMVYSENIYILYSEIATLFCKRNDILATLDRFDTLTNWQQFNDYSISANEEIIKDVDRILKNPEMLKDEEKVKNVKKIRETASVCIEEIKIKYDCLEKQMAQLLIESIKREP